MTDRPDPLAFARLLRRRYPFMVYLSEAVACPFCQVPAGEPCQTRTGGSPDFPHSDRTVAFEAEVNRG